MGRYAKLKWLLRLGPKIGVTPARIELLKLEILKNAPRLLFLAKLTVGFPIHVLITTGLSRVPPHRWVGMLVLGELIKSAAFVATGYACGSAIQQASVNIRAIPFAITGVFLVAGIIWFKRYRKKMTSPG